MKEQGEKRDGGDSWAAFAERVRGIARNKLRSNWDGFAIICVDLVVNRYGDPVLWLEPRVARRIEPSASASNILLGHFADRVRDSDEPLGE